MRLARSLVAEVAWLEAGGALEQPLSVSVVTSAARLVNCNRDRDKYPTFYPF
jgi:hypothetical protein